jgi:hypothetical protein
MLIGPEGAAAHLAFDQLVGGGKILHVQRVVVFKTGHPANYA